MKKCSIIILAVGILGLSGCAALSKSPNELNNSVGEEKTENQNTEDTTSASEIYFPETYNKQDGVVTFDCELIVPEEVPVTGKRYIAKKLQIDTDTAESIYLDDNDILEHESYETIYDYTNEYYRLNNDTTFSITPYSLWYSNFTVTAALDYGFEFDEDERYYNKELYDKDDNLDFETQEEAAESLQTDLKNIGVDDVDINYNIYVCDKDTLDSEYHRIIEAENPPDDDGSDGIYEGYYFTCRQEIGGLPVFAKGGDVLYQDIESNSPVQAYYTADGLQMLEVGDLFEFKECSDEYSLCSFDVVAQTISDHFNYMITDNTYNVIYAKLYNYVLLTDGTEDEYNYTVTPVWIVKVQEIDPQNNENTIQYEYNAITGEVFNRG